MASAICVRGCVTTAPSIEEEGPAGRRSPDLVEAHAPRGLLGRHALGVGHERVHVRQRQQEPHALLPAPRRAQPERRVAAVVAQIEVRHEAAVVPVEPREPLEHGVVAAEAGDVRRHGPVLAVHRVEAVDALAVEEVQGLHGRQVPVEGRLPHGRDLAVVGLRVLRAEALHLLGRELGLAEGALRGCGRVLGGGGRRGAAGARARARVWRVHAPSGVAVGGAL